MPIEALIPTTNPDTIIKEAVHKRDYGRFFVTLEQGLCTQSGKNHCLYFAAAAKGCGNYSDALLNAKAHMQYYLDGRLVRSAIKGSIPKINKWLGLSANLHFDNDRPLRAAILAGKKDAAEYLMYLGCDFDRAVADIHKTKYDNKREVLEIMTFLRHESAAGAYINRPR